MILRKINGEEVNLSQSINFVNHYNTKSSAAAIIIEQFNTHNLYDFLKGYNDLKVIDIGANVGLFSIFVSPVASKVYSVEPTPDHARLFNELVTLSNIKNIELHPLGIHYESGEIEFHIHDLNSTMNSFVTHKTYHHSNNTVKVATKTLSEFIDSLNCGAIDFVKMDIEGLETDLILHPSFQSCKDKIRSMHVEVHDFSGNEDIESNIQKITKSLESWNKKIHRINEDSILIH